MSRHEERIRILIADDSVVYRSQIRAALAGIRRVEVLGASPNGKLMLERLVQTGADLVILDLEMPGMGGIETLREIRKAGLPCKVLVFSSSTKSGAEATLEALELGATDFINKPDAGFTSSGGDPALKIRELLEPKILSLFPEQKTDLNQLARIEPDASFPKIHWDLLRPKIIVIGSSTGGPGVLEKIFAEVKPPLLCPIVIAQHMPPVFTATLAQRISAISGIPAREAEHGKPLETNCIHIAPGDYHLRVSGPPERPIALLDQGPKVHSVRPAVDHLFTSAAELYQGRCLGIVLTGMGADGRDGAIAIKNRGGAVVIQSEKTCVVFGMPGAVHAAGAFDRIAHPGEIASIVREKATPHPHVSNRTGKTGRI